MAAALCIQVHSTLEILKTEIEFFHVHEWTADTEILLIHYLHELLTMVRPMGKAVSINIDVEVTDPRKVIFLINKKINTGVQINTQRLTGREIEIIGFIMQGFTNNEIAQKLFISYETVKSHRKHILLKTGAKNSAALINYYHQTFYDK